GALFASGTKPAARRATPAHLRAARAHQLPLVAIGGITAENARLAIDAGADLVAVIGGVFDAPDPVAAARAIHALFHRQPGHRCTLHPRGHPMDTRRSHDLFERAQALMPGGVNSPVRAFRSVGGEPFFAQRAEGP